MGDNDFDRIYDKLDHLAVTSARIEERQENTNKGMAMLNVKVESMRDGSWVCPTGQVIAARVDRMERNCNGGTKSSASEPFRFDGRTIAKVIAAVVAGLIIGVSSAATFLAAP